MRRLFVVVVLICVALLLAATPVLAVANPDSISIGDVYVFEDVLEAGDVLVYVRYDVDYAVEPSEDADETFQMAIYGTNGITLIAVRPLNYYQENIISIYLSAATNTLTTGGAYYIRIMGNPAIFAMLENVTMDTRVLTGGDWYTAAELGGIMLTQAGILQTDWSITLLANDLLNTTGATYFLKAIPNLSTMAPNIFGTVTSSFTYINTAFNNTGLNMVKQNQPVSLNNAMTGLNAIFGITNPNWGSAGWAFLMALIVGSVVYGATRRPDISILGGSFSTLALEGYMGIANGNILLFVMSVGAAVIIWFVVAFILPQYG